MKWPDRKQVDEAFRRLVAGLCGRQNIQGIGYVGSYARGDWGVGSDLDVVAVVSTEDAVSVVRDELTDLLLELPVPADLSVLTPSRLERIRAAETRYYRVVCNETVWACGGLTAAPGQGNKLR
ncbi:MAG: nucleotidyltransferase domain-containing protein [bacterium]